MAKFAEIVKKHKECNLPYHEFKTMRSAVIAHFKHLKDLGQNHPIGIKLIRKTYFCNVFLFNSILHNTQFTTMKHLLSDNNLSTSQTLAMAAALVRIKVTRKRYYKFKFGRTRFYQIL
jgi:hypothetical protein